MQLAAAAVRGRYGRSIAGSAHHEDRACQEACQKGPGAERSARCRLKRQRQGQTGTPRAGESRTWGLPYRLELFPCLHLQLKVKEERETKRASMDARHTYIASVLCTKLTMNPSEVEETFLEGDQVGAAND